jgi:hypothetical protein
LLTAIFQANLPSEQPMISPEGKPTAKTSAQTLEWQMCEDERDWDAAQHPFATAPAQIESQAWTLGKLRRWGVPAACIVLSLALLGGWLWQRAQAGLAELESELEAEIVAELWRDRESHALDQMSEASLLNSVETSNDPVEIVTEVEIRDVGSDWAVVEVLLKLTAGGSSYRQARVYHDRGLGWVRGEVTAAHWGEARQLETEYFIIHYRTLDEAAVMQAAPQLDTLYPELLNSLHRELTVSEKLRVTVDPEYVLGMHVRNTGPQVGIVVASPSATLAPEEVAASDLLLQSIMLKMYNRLPIHAPTNDNLPSSWFRIHDSLRLWFIWEHELPLAVWRKPLVKWILEAAEDGARPAKFDVPAFADELCLHHGLWMLSPLDIAVPILCWDRYAGEQKVTTWPSYETIAELSPGSLIYSAPITSVNSSTYQEVQGWQVPYTVILATVFEYVASRYGSERIPLLLAAIPEHDRAETLIPAVFDVSLAEFTEGWRAFLAERYELTQ